MTLKKQLGDRNPGRILPRHSSKISAAETSVKSQCATPKKKKKKMQQQVLPLYYCLQLCRVVLCTKVMNSWLLDGEERTDIEKERQKSQPLSHYSFSSSLSQGSHKKLTRFFFSGGSGAKVFRFIAIIFDTAFHMIKSFIFPPGKKRHTGVFVSCHISYGVTKHCLCENRNVY